MSVVIKEAFQLVEQCDIHLGMFAVLLSKTFDCNLNPVRPDRTIDIG
jgi:hypothetical protein